MFLNDNDAKKYKVRAAVTQKIDSVDAEWSSIARKDIMFFLILVFIYACCALFLFPNKPEIYLGVGMPLFYVGWKFMTNIVDTNRFLERIEAASQVSMAHNLIDLENKEEDKNNS